MKVNIKPTKANGCFTNLEIDKLCLIALCSRVFKMDPLAIYRR